MDKVTIVFMSLFVFVFLLNVSNLKPWSLEKASYQLEMVSLDLEERQLELKKALEERQLELKKALEEDENRLECEKSVMEQAQYLGNGLHSLFTACQQWRGGIGDF